VKFGENRETKQGQGYHRTQMIDTIPVLYSGQQTKQTRKRVFDCRAAVCKRPHLRGVHASTHTCTIFFFGFKLIAREQNIRGQMERPMQNDAS
jgi:hypothetical protein